MTADHPVESDILWGPPRGPKAHKDVARRLGIPHNSAAELIVLDYNNDPFYIGTPGDVRDAEWFAGLIDQFGLHFGAHTRRVHYRMVTSHETFKMPDGQPYLNTTTCSNRLDKASGYARILGLVDVESMVDRRNDAAIENAAARDTVLSRPYLYQGDSYYELPELAWPEKLDSVTGGILTPSALGYNFDPVDARPVMIELWVEKSTMADVLEPLCRNLHLNYVQGAGFESITQTVSFLRRAEQYGKAAHILYVSDFDPGGTGMPVAVARQLQFWLEQLGIDVDISVDATIITHEQCIEYELPRTPIKGTDNRKNGFESRYGEGATELDALEALHPGVLAGIIRQAVEPFIDRDLQQRLLQIRTGRRFRANGEEDNATDAIDDAWITAGGPYLENQMRDLVGEANGYAAEQAKRIHKIMDETREHLKEFTAAANKLGVEAYEIGSTITVDLPERPAPEIAGPGPDVLFDSRRHWLDQLAVFKGRQNGHSNGGGS